MNKLVSSVEIASVDDLYEQYKRFARSYELADNPLAKLTSIIPRSAQFYTIAETSKLDIAIVLMKRIAGRRKLRDIVVHKDEIRHMEFTASALVTILYA